MGYKYKTECFETAQEVYDLLAQDCSNQITVSSNIAVITKCLSTATGYDVWSYRLDNGALVQSNSAQIPHIVPQTFSCTYTAPSTNTTIPTADVIEMAWLVVGVWVAAWAFRKMADAIRQKA